MSRKGGAAAAATMPGAPAGYKSTNTVQFRGQDKGKDHSLGNNPNVNIEDEYIGNLQQQVHFMELELKILKEKVVDDEKNSGIGSLFDDEKSSHQHIDLLKTKYVKMRRDYELLEDRMSNKMIDVKGSQKIYDSQIDAIQLQMSELYDKKEEYEARIKKDLYDTEKKVKDANKVRGGLDQDVKTNNNQFLQEGDQRMKNFLILENGSQFDGLNGGRYTRDSKHVESFFKMKDDGHKKVMDARAAADADYMGRKDLQDQITKMNEHLEGIETDHVQLQSLSVQIQVLETNTAFLDEQKMDLDGENKKVIEMNDDLEKRVKANQEVKLKQLKAKIDRDFKNTNPEVKELSLKEETQAENNNDFSTKLGAEKEKMDQLLDECVRLREEKKVKLAEKAKVIKNREEQDLKMGELKTTIDLKQTEVNGVLKTVEKARELNLREDERNRNLKKQFAAWQAKKDFIEKNYDYSTIAKEMQPEYFENLVTSNNGVNKSMTLFTGKLQEIQKEILDLETRQEQKSM